ncbi:PIN domain-containing protein [Pseudomonas putida]|uniref:GapS6b family protein n=1 Tax=Pseudomonas putida TaxID=303 RepID=UPI000BF01371|nr:hypothetical protein [Pseudomonas putida]MDD2023239.1 hypothetical protein [Pseudomonas putida]PEI10172.1 hypothetical protein CRM86_20670 [Pseudomonas putida]
MLQRGDVSTINQSHSGSGDNVQHKHLYQIQALAPANLSKAIALVIGSIREKKTTDAKIRLETLRATVDTNSDSGALLDVIAIYGDLLEPGQSHDAFNAVLRIAASTTDETVRDLCIAGLLKFSGKVGHEEAAQAEYRKLSQPGPYSTEAFYRYFATQETLLAVSKQLILSDGELTGLVEGALRLRALDIAAPAAARLDEMSQTYNSRVLLTLTRAMQLNPAVKKRQYWLSDPQLKLDVDQLVEDVSTLIEQSEGTDARLYDMAGPMLHYFQVVWPARLVDVCAKYPDLLAVTWPDLAARVRSITGDKSALSERMLAFSLAQGSNAARSAWCQARLEAEIDLQDALRLIQLSTPGELRQWIALDNAISDATEIDKGIVSLMAHAKLVRHSEEIYERYQLGILADEFITRFEAQFAELTLFIVVELAQALFNAELPHKGLAITSRLLPEGDLWPSPFVLLHLRCLLETEQFQSFDQLVARIPDNTHVALLRYRSMKEEVLGHPELALAYSDQMIEEAPELLTSWLQGCSLRERYKAVDEQRRFHDLIPDHLLEDFSHNTLLAMRYLVSGGNFQRAEPRLVRWFMENPSARATELVNFHFGFAIRQQATFIDTQKLPGYLGGVSFEQEGVKQLRMVVEEGVATGQHVLTQHSRLARLLASMEVGQSQQLGIVTYKLLERLPPYVVCLRLAAQLRHLQNDGSDEFAVLTIPNDPEQFGPTLQRKLRFNRSGEKPKPIEDMPLYLQGHAMQGHDPIKAAIDAWTDSAVPKSWLVGEGEERPDEVVLDAYSMVYLALNGVVDRLVDLGITLILPAETKELLERWLKQTPHQAYSPIGFDDSGQLVPNTAWDIEARAEYMLRGLQRILAVAAVRHPVVHDTEIEFYAIRDVIDQTVYLAMKLSSANDAPWLCMDLDFARVHQRHGFKVANVHHIMTQATDTANFNFEDKRHGLLLCALGAVPRPLMKIDLDGLARNPNPLSSFILSKVFQTYGDAIFADGNQQNILLQAIIKHVVCTYYRDNRSALWPAFTPVCRYETHAFNHGLRVFISCNREKTAEYWVALALKVCVWVARVDSQLVSYVVELFVGFVVGHFLDERAVMEHYQMFE